MSKFPFKKASFVSSAAKDSQMLSPVDKTQKLLPEIALCGRSNVGKSSLINHLLRSGKLSKVSATPGKTRLVNFFLVDDGLQVVDLPGYGYAKASKTDQAKWSDSIQNYFESRKQQILLLILIDSRHPPMPLDLQMIESAVEMNLPFIIVLTKTDKLSRSQCAKHVQSVTKELSSQFDLEQFTIVPHSTKQGEGRAHLIKAINEQLAKYGHA